ncbi:MAG: DNA-protecting protein DprA [Anaerolineae bacterium CG_4_9_14_3_um_filter_57_17]|nr:DNA-protecting protein DprA [bacterium]NCT20501.1 DNA-protecting protein DprA [bacterium]OIO84018.1 MAG: DNA protecting protein DprA [Anaerolineae bacterium CG2_30_57_67]PJB68270.1 MAG: DNA-protecting protein DprA [Anaerolineae bacterium CG_4_9_14_3_um_filter_57_17]
MDDRRFWVGFTLVKGIGAVRLQALFDYFSDLESAWNASPLDLTAAGLSAKIAERVILARKNINLDEYLAGIEKSGIRLLTWNDAHYPLRLKEIDQPPPVLYLCGEITPEDDWSVAIVGTRAVSAYGRQVTEELASVLAGNGVTIVSGLARGVDAVAHNAALKAGGRTIGVLGSGVDKIYPPEHRALAEKMAAQGAVISDYAPGTPPDATNFPPRNRIISGLARAVVVIEAGETSGALITASFAAEQGREVFAVPGNIYAPQSKGANRLIANGAHPLLSPADLLTALDLNRNVERREIRQNLPSEPVEAALWNLLGAEPLHVDDIRARTGLPIEKISAALTMMELKGMVRQVGGMTYVGMREPPGEYNVK